VKDEIAGQVEGLGSNLIFVIPQQLDQGGPAAGGGNPFAIRKQFTSQDADLLTRRLGTEAIVVGVLQSRGQLRSGNRSMNTNIAAGNDQGEDVFTATLAAGRHYTHSEWVSGARVVALGATVRDRLFPAADPIGRRLDVNGQSFTIVGYYKAKGGSFAGDEDNQVYIPSTTAQRLLGTDALTQIVVKAEDPRRIPELQARVRQLLTPKFGDQLTVFTQEQTLGVLSTLLGTLTAMLAGLASISLVVGGIGIMNIMLVSVSERTREIGIRKAVGARTHDILSQFVIEATVLSLAGGVLGVAVGWLGAIVLDRWVPTELTAWAVALAFFFSAAVGIFFGVYPAWKASRLDPIEALRYE
jgi:putative ABC transport system permease protein